MKKLLYSILFCAGITGLLASCGGKDYLANPSSNANASVNPLNPLTSSQFTWTGTAPLTVYVNGAPWTADTAIYSFIDSSGTNYILGWKGKQYLALYLTQVYGGGNIYNMQLKTYNTIGVWYDLDSISSINSEFTSLLGNSGEIKVIENDSAKMVAQFYFQGVNGYGGVYNFSNGYLSINK
jgi:hypothetical protein